MCTAVSWRKMASRVICLPWLPNLLAGTCVGGMRGKFNVHASLTSVVAHTMGCPFPGCAQFPNL